MSAADLKPFQIRLSLKGNVPKIKSIQSSKPNHVVSIAPQMSMDELLHLSYELFGVPKGKNYTIELYSGFPPKLIDLSDAGSRASLVTANGISGGEAMIVKIEKKSKAKPAADSISSSSKSGGNSSLKRSLPESSACNESEVSPIKSESSSATSRPKRASAQAATDSFKDIIRAQDKVINSEKKKSASTSKSKSTNTKNEPSAAQIAARKRAATFANSRKLAALPGGRRLDDDRPSPVESPNVTSSPMRKTKKTSNSIFKNLGSEDDISFALISSLDSGSKGGKVSKVLRASMKKTVEKSYEASRAVVRNSAIASRKATFSQVANQGGNTNNSTGTSLVKYPKSVEGRGYFEEQVHIITPMMLKAVVQAVYDDHDENDLDGESASGREMLKPSNMALLSPRVFWSLWYHYQDNCASIEQALDKMLPDLDWSFLHNRFRQLSEKAKENLLQKDGPGGEVKAKDAKAGIRAVQAVEKAMETMYDETVVDARERAAQAALARFGQADHDNWVVQTPTDVDEDEVKECIAACQDVLDDEVINQCIRTLQSRLLIHNWRELANAVPEAVLSILVEKGVKVETGAIEAWIAAAQSRSIEEIMLEIIDSDQDLYEILSDELSSATPKDLALWANAPDLIIEEARSQVMVSENDLKKYCLRARKAIETLQWLETYSTSICASI
jgi:hypothetical protein